MGKLTEKLFKRQSLIYKLFLFGVVVLAILYLFPKGGKFKYEFQKGKPWQNENLYAPFDFPIYKTDEEIAAEEQKVKSAVNPYYNYDSSVYPLVSGDIEKSYPEYFADTVPEIVKTNLLKAVKEIYKTGVVVDFEKDEKGVINLITDGNQVEEVKTSAIFKLVNRDKFVEDRFNNPPLNLYTDQIKNILYDKLEPNISRNKNFTSKAEEEALSKISYTRGTVYKEQRIIVKGEVVEGEKYTMLLSLQKEYKSQLWSENNYVWVVVGYTILIAIAILMLMLFLKKYRTEIYRNNTKVTFIFFNVILMVFLTTLALKYSVRITYAIPLTILPIILKAFFDSRTGLFVHVITVLLLGFVVPNSFEFVFIQIVAGIVGMLTVAELYKRANLFLSVGQITLVYLISYVAFYIISEGAVNTESLSNLGYFLINGLITVVSAQSLIYIYEKVFKLDSDVSLLELSDTNSRLLRELSEKAPGTFHHSLQVANLCEAAANEIGANAMLVRVGALYHDIGKMNNPTFFTENQKGSLNPHDELEPKESARIIINHVLDGINLAKKNNLPDRIIDFIRTHHGTSAVYYFYKKQQELDGEAVNEEDFRYKGPIPFSKETAILMMSDSVEAASKSLKNPTYSLIDSFVEKIVDKQMDDGQFLNADITFKEIEKIKKVLKQKLVNIYHLRVEYPE